MPETALFTAGAKDCAVFDMVLMPKYAVVMVLIAVNALVSIATSEATLPLAEAAFHTAKAAAAAIATSPPMTTQSPVQARVRWTLLSLGLLLLLGCLLPDELAPVVLAGGYPPPPAGCTGTAPGAACASAAILLPLRVLPKAG